MATSGDLAALGFNKSEVATVRVNIEHPDPSGLGPFCRLKVRSAAPTGPGVYAWTVDDNVMYVGKASYLLHVVSGARLGRPYNDYTYVPASKVRQKSSPRVRVNGLLNRAIVDGSQIAWWWKPLESVEVALRVEAQIIGTWSPPWNRARPYWR